MNKTTRYFNYNDNPVILERRHFPVMLVKGKEVVFRDHFKLFTDSEEITKEEFDEMVKRTQSRATE